MSRQNFISEPFPAAHTDFVRAFGDILLGLGAHLVAGLAIAIGVLWLRLLVSGWRIVASAAVVGLAWWAGVRWWVELLAMATVAAVTLAAATKLVELIRGEPDPPALPEGWPGRSGAVEVVRPFDEG